MKPEAAVEPVSQIAVLGPWGLVVLVVCAVLLFAWVGIRGLRDVFKEQVEALRAINVKFAEHALADVKLHDETRGAVRDEVDRLRAELSTIATVGDLQRAADNVVLRMRAGPSGESSSSMPAVRPTGRGSRPGG